MDVVDIIQETKYYCIILLMYKECCALRSIILVYPSPALVWTYWCVAVLYSYINTHVFCTVYCRNILITVDHWHKIRNNSTTVNADNINHHLNYFTPSPIHPSLCHPAPSVDWNPNLNLWFVVRAWSDPESHSGWGRDRTLVPDCTVQQWWVSVGTALGSPPSPHHQERRRQE